MRHSDSSAHLFAAARPRRQDRLWYQLCQQLCQHSTLIVVGGSFQLDCFPSVLDALDALWCSQPVAVCRAWALRGLQHPRTAQPLIPKAGLDRLWAAGHLSARPTARPTARHWRGSALAQLIGSIAARSGRLVPMALCKWNASQHYRYSRYQ